MTLRFDFESIVRDVCVYKADNADRLPGAPLIAVDECFNNDAVNSLIVTICNQGLASGADPLWNQRRIRPDGSVLYVWGGLSRRHAHRRHAHLGERSLPEEGFSWDDQAVLFCLCGQLCPQRPLVLLTENTANDQLGLRRLLREHVGPAIDARIRDGVSLTALFKKGKTSFPEYAAQVVNLFQGQQWRAGYNEQLL